MSLNQKPIEIIKLSDNVETPDRLKAGTAPKQLAEL